ncbi:MAG: GGDEF domain-containing protein [Rubrivivax sp.]|nr:GGDEF domain-containing protein [Rubrivivax sp.]
MGLAAGLGFALAWWLQPAASWLAGLAAGAGAALAAVPLCLALFGLARRVEAAVQAGAGPVGGDAAADASAALGAAAGALHGAVGMAPGASAQGVSLSREMFMDMVAREWSRARRYGTGAALLLVEVDRYPRLTEALGETAGEKVLAEVLAGTAPTLRGADALARYEAGRFTVFLAHADATGALDVAERIRERAEQMEVPVPPRRVRFTVSVGVAHLRPAHLYLQALLDDVVDALAAARGAGGNCVRAAPLDAGLRPTPGAARDGSRADKK